MPYTRKYKPRAKRTGKLTVKKVTQIVKKLNASEEETKLSSGHISSGQLVNNTPYVCSPVQLFGSGTSDNQRIGRQIYLRYVKLSGELGNVLNIPEVRVRVMCVECTNYTGATDPSQLTGTGSVAGLNFIQNIGLFQTQSGTASNGNLYNALIDNKNTQVKVLMDKRYVIRPPNGTSIVTVPFKYTVKFMEKRTYIASTPGGFENKNHYFIFIPYSLSAGNVPVCSPDIDYFVSFNDA